MIVQRVILQAGPATEIDDPYRDAHSALRDPNFCRKVLQQVQQRLEAIHRNWREPVLMDNLISMLLKLASLSTDQSILAETKDSLRKARTVCGKWRTELWSTITKDPKSTPFAIWASLLCKRTMHLDCSLLLEPDDLRQFLDSSIVLHYALTANFTTLPLSLRSGVIRDCLFTFDNRDFLRQAILENAPTFVAAIHGLWEVDETSRTLSDLEHIPDTYWIFFTVSSSSPGSYCIQSITTTCLAHYS